MREISTLDNGLRIVTHYMPAVESVTFGVWNAVGCRDENEEINGIAHFLEHMAFKGTKTKSALQIMEKVDSVGGYINAYTSEEITAYWVKLLATDLHIGIDIIADIIQNSTFENPESQTDVAEYLENLGIENCTDYNCLNDNLKIEYSELFINDTIIKCLIF